LTRLPDLERPHSLAQKLRFGLMRRFLGRVPGPVLAMSYRRDLCGKHLGRCYQEGLRQMKEWPVGEIELFAAFVSSLNRCQF
jgi:hypothetical protein